MSTTPTVDARAVTIDCELAWDAVHADFARQLESALRAARLYIATHCGQDQTSVLTVIDKALT